MKNHLTKVLWLAIGLLVLVIVFLSIQYGLGPFKKADNYYAVALTSGDMYFGKLSWWPSLILSDVWFIQRDSAATSTPALSLNKLTNVFWGPEDKIKLSRENILMIAKLRPDSQVVQTIKSPKSPAVNVPSSQ